MVLVRILMYCFLSIISDKSDVQISSDLLLAIVPDLI
jgi:hypothetical protein